MTRHSQIIPECYADTALVEMLGFKRPNHQLGIGKVVRMFEKELKNKVAVGIIDDDKLKPRDLDAFEVIEEIHGIKRLTKGIHSILVICPAFEDWIFTNAEKTNIDTSKYGFRTRKDFEDACKRTDVSRNQSVKQLLNTLKQKNAPGFQQLKVWICAATGIDAKDIS